VKTDDDAFPRAGRREIERLLKGQACFTDDVHLDGMLHAVFVRSPVAHARINGIDSSAALAAGALLVLTAEDLPFIDRTFNLRYASPHIRGGLPSFLARERVRFVGEPVALLVAPSQYLAEDLAALVTVDFEELPVLGTVTEALDSAASPLHPEWTGNVAAAFTRTIGAPDVALRNCAHRLERNFEFGRQAPLPLETRGCVADFQASDGSLRVWSSIQTHYTLRDTLAHALDLPPQQVRVIATDVGGGFGSKSRPYVEDVVVSHASRVLRRPVKWIEDRFEHLQATTHSRASATQLEVGFDAQGRIEALKARLVVDIGAYVFSSGIITAEVAASVLAGAYRVPNLSIEVLCVGTNKTPLGTYRGAGQPEGALPLECMVDMVARTVGKSAMEVRHLNIIRPEDLPYRVWAPGEGVTGEVESGDYPLMLDRAAAGSGYSEGTEVLATGERCAWGMACGFEMTGYVNFESAKVRINVDGSVTVWSGMSAQGQGQSTTFAVVCAEVLGVAVESVSVHMGDTDLVPFGRGAFGSRGAVLGANAVAGAGRLLREKVLAAAAALLRRPEADLEISAGEVLAKGDPSGVTLKNIAAAVGPGGPLFAGEPALEAHHVFDHKNRLTFALSVHAVRTALDPRTGIVRLLDYFVVHDAGRELDPGVVEGQIVGGVAEGIGGALLSEVLYGDGAQPLTCTLADYLVATAPEIPRIRVDHVTTLPTTNPLGVRGVGECGVIPVAAAIANAVSRAIGGQAIGHEESLFKVPISPPAVLAALARAAQHSRKP
jgi:carbon-monoxide dehydrogenase large subunit